MKIDTEIGLYHCLCVGAVSQEPSLLAYTEFGSTCTILTNRADPNEKPYYTSFYLGLHCLPISTRLEVSSSYTSGFL